MEGILNLKKNDILDLSKKDPSLNNLVLAAGWDVAKKGFFSFNTEEFDLDLVAVLLNEDEKMIDSRSLIFFANRSSSGIYLHGDNVTGEGDGDDEKISVKLSELPKKCKKVVFALCIYAAEKRKQSFKKVKNAYVRLLDSDKGNAEICRYNLSEDGSDNTAIIFAELENINGSWNFKAVGELLNASAKTIKDRY